MFVEMFRRHLQSPDENAVLVYLGGTPIWRSENSVNIWNLLWLSRQLIITTEKQKQVFT